MPRASRGGRSKTARSGRPSPRCAGSAPDRGRYGARGLHARAALHQLLDDLSARRIRERREGEVENRGRHIFNLWVEYSNWPALVKRSEVTPLIYLVAGAGFEPTTFGL